MNVNGETTQARRARRHTKLFCTGIASCVFVFFVPSWFISLHGHSGPPFPIVNDRVTGAYNVSIWTDPDATDDQSAAGKFWVTVQPSARGVALPDSTTVNVSIKPLDRDGPQRSAGAGRLNGDVRRQFVALLMDHEGPYGVHVTITGPLGTTAVDSVTDATYDLRPRPILTVLFLAPFLLVGFVWGKLLIKRTMAARGGR
jgi:hypothetical protein